MTAPAPVDAPSRAATLGRQVRDRWASSGIYLALATVVVALAVASPAFRTVDNMVNIGRQSAVVAIGAFAMTFVIMLGEIDLSIGAVASAAGVVTAQRLAAGDPVLVAVLVGMLTAAGFGVLNGLLVVYGRLPSFIATLGSFYLAQGISLSLTSGQTISYRADGFRASFATGSLLGVPTPLLWSGAMFTVLWWLLHRSRYGADVTAIGGDARSAAVAGLAVARRRFATFVLAGSLMGLAAMILVGRIGNARSDAGVGLEFDAIAAVVIGGTSFTGGRGSLVRTVVGVLFIGVVNNGLALLNVDYNTQQIVKGVLVVAAVLLDRWAGAATRATR